MLLGKGVSGSKRICSLLPVCSTNPTHTAQRIRYCSRTYHETRKSTTYHNNLTLHYNHTGNRDNKRCSVNYYALSAAVIVTASASLVNEEKNSIGQTTDIGSESNCDNAPDSKDQSDLVPNPPSSLESDDLGHKLAVESVSNQGEGPKSALEMDPLPPPHVMRYLDDMYAKEEFQDLALSLERFSELNNDEMLWRRARAEWEVLKLLGSSFGKDAVSRLKGALEMLDQALELNEGNSNAHRWKAIISNGYTEKLGMKEQFGNLSAMKYHLERALELNPHDGTACTLLGIWHMELQELGWIQRKFAATFLGSVPATSYEEALKFFLMAEEVAPKEWVRNLFLIAKAYLALGDRMNAKKYLELTLDQEPTIKDDHVIQEEAEKLYKKHYVVLM